MPQPEKSDREKGSQEESSSQETRSRESKGTGSERETTTREERVRQDPVVEGDPKEEFQCPDYQRPFATRTCPKTLKYRTKRGRSGQGFQGVYHHTRRGRDESASDVLCDPANENGECSTKPSTGKTYYFHSGVNRGVYLDWIAEEQRKKEGGIQIGAMVNARSAAQPGMIEAYLRNPNVPLVLDSGAFQKESPAREEYRNVLSTLNQRMKDRGGQDLFERFQWVANLDVIEGFGTGRNFYWLREAGIEPLWTVHVGQMCREEGRTGIDLEPPPERAFELEQGMTIGIGGLVPLVKQDTAQAHLTIEKVGNELSKRGFRGHFFGLGCPSILKRFGKAPWMESADSSKWLVGQKAQKAYRNDGSSVQVGKRGLSFTREECARQNVRQIAEWMENGQEQKQMALEQGTIETMS